MSDVLALRSSIILKAWPAAHALHSVFDSVTIATLAKGVRTTLVVRTQAESSASARACNTPSSTCHTWRDSAHRLGRGGPAGVRSGIWCKTTGGCERSLQGVSSRWTRALRGRSESDAHSPTSPMRAGATASPNHHLHRVTRPTMPTERSIAMARGRKPCASGWHDKPGASDMQHCIGRRDDGAPVVYLARTNLGGCDQMRQRPLVSRKSWRWWSASQLT